jgi:hypothetical protein
MGSKNSASELKVLKTPKLFHSLLEKILEDLNSDILKTLSKY